MIGLAVKGRVLNAQQTTKRSKRPRKRRADRFEPERRRRADTMGVAILFLAAIVTSLLVAWHPQSALHLSFGKAGSSMGGWLMGWLGLTTTFLPPLLVVFGIGRPMLKKASNALAKRAEESKSARGAMGGQIAGALAERTRTENDMKVTLEMIEATRDYEARAALIRGFVRQDPARAALVVRDLIRNDTKQGA